MTAYDFLNAHWEELKAAFMLFLIAFTVKGFF